MQFWPTLLIRPLKPISARAMHSVSRLAVTLFATHALAQAANEQPPGVSTATMLQTVLGLAVVIGVLFLAAYFLRKLNGGRAFGNNSPLRVVGTLALGARERIVLVEIEATWIVVGLVPGQIRTLHTLPKGELKAPERGDRNFAQWLKQVNERSKE